LRAGFPGPDQNTKFQDGDRRDACPTQTVIVPPKEVREKFRRVKPLKEIPISKRGWTLDVLNIVRRLCEVGTAGPSRPRTPRRGVPTNTFTTTDACAFTRELEKLHPDNRHFRDNPVNNTGQESASSFKSFRLRHASARQAAMLDYWWTRSRPLARPSRAFGFAQMELPLLPMVFPRFTIRRFRDQQTFRRWAPSLPLSRPHGLCRWQILFAISQMAQIPNGSSHLGRGEWRLP
jgi:hypothetical protein